MRQHTIHTCYDCAPVPLRQFDWTAILDGYEGSKDAPSGNVCGKGATELEAIKDLLNC